MRKFRVGVVALLTGSMAAVGVGCGPQPTSGRAGAQANWVGNGIAFLIISGLCNYTNFCPIPGDPVGTPVVTVPPEVPAP